MATTETTPSVAQSVENMVESMINLGTSLVRLGASAVVLPLSILPPKARETTIQTAHDLLASVEKIHVSVFKTASRVASTWLNEIDSAVGAAAPAPTAPAAKTIVIDGVVETK